jgi:hypothetical protein
MAQPGQVRRAGLYVAQRHRELHDGRYIPQWSPAFDQAESFLYPFIIGAMTDIDCQRWEHLG